MDSNLNSALETEKVGKLVRQFSVPCIISLLVAAFYNIVDQIFIANASYLGSYGNAANSVVFPLTIVALAFATMIGDGTCAYVSICLGRKENENASKAVGTGVVVALILGVFFTVIYMAFSTPILELFGARVNEETFAMAKEYLFWLTVGILFYIFGQAMNPIIRSDGNPKFAMATLVTGAVINIILDPIFIYPLKLGMKGAALATIAGQIVAAVMSAVYLTKMKTVKLKKRHLRLSRSVLKRSIPLGMSSFLSQISMVFSMVAVNNMAKKYGALDPVFGQAEYAQIPTAVIGIVMKFYQVIISIAIGLSAGCIPVIGYNVGAKRHDRVKELLKTILGCELIVGLIATLIFETIPGPLINIFGAANESSYYTEFAIKTIRLFLCALPLSCFNKGIFISLQALGKATESTILSLIREVVLGVGLALLLPALFGIDGLLYFMMAADIITAIIAVFVLRNIFGHINKDIKDAELQKAPQAEVTE